MRSEGCAWRGVIYLEKNRSESYPRLAGHVRDGDAVRRATLACRRVHVRCLRGGARLESHLAHLLQSHTLGNRNRRHGGDLLARKLDDILLHHAGARERRLHAWRREIGGGGGMKGQRCDSNEVACASRASKRVQRARFEPPSAAASSRNDQRPYARRHEITPNPITLKEAVLPASGTRARARTFVTADDRNTPSDTSAGGLRGNRERHLDESGVDATDAISEWPSPRSASTLYPVARFAGLFA